MYHFKKFKNYSEYIAYLLSGNVYLPQIAMIVNAGDAHTTDDKTDDLHGPTWIDFKNANSQFIRIANGGNVLLHNQIAVDGLYDYIAEYVDNDVVFHVYHTGTTNEISEEDEDYDTYAIKYNDDGTVIFPHIYRVTFDNEY